MNKQIDKNGKCGSAKLCLLYTFLYLYFLGFYAKYTDFPFQTGVYTYHRLINEHFKIPNGKVNARPAQKMKKKHAFPIFAFLLGHLQLCFSLHLLLVQNLHTNQRRKFRDSSGLFWAYSQLQTCS